MFELKNYNDALKLHKAGKIIPGLTVVTTNEFTKGNGRGCTYVVISTGDAHKKGTLLSEVCDGIAFEPKES